MSFLCSWSGGKDSCYAYYIALKMGYKPSVLLNVMNEHGDRSRSHGIPRQVLEAQAEALQVPICFFNSTWDEYEKKYVESLKKLVNKYPITHSVFGDIDIESHKDWEEKVSKKAGLIALLPLWQGNRKQLVLDMIEAGIEAIIVSCNMELGPAFLGRTIDAKIIEEFEQIGVDACGENGEFHTLVVDAPFFNKKINVEISSKVTSSNYNFANLNLI